MSRSKSTIHSQEGRPDPVGQTFRSVLASYTFPVFSRIVLTFHSREERLAPAWLALALLVLSAAAFSQGFPDKIRGYKVHRDKIEVSATKAEDRIQDASATIGDPKLIEVTLTGVTFELPADILAAKQSGKVDFLAFRDVKVNGVAVEVEEYRHPFEFKKGESIALPKPARIFLPVTGIVQAALKEMRDSRAEWTVTGRVFVFGRFRKFGMPHKRVVPVDFEIKINNPLK